MKVYLDESGFTGADFCNTEQPLFVLAATWFDQDYATRIETDIISQFNFSEMKFAKLISTDRGRAKAVDIIKQIGEKEPKSRFAVYVVHKQSALVRKFVMDCIEPTMAERGVEMLNDGSTVTYANLINTVMPAYLGMDWFEEFLGLFNVLIRSRQESDNRELLGHCLQTKNHPEAFQIFEPYLSRPGLVMEELSNPNYRSDTYESILMGLVVHLRHMFNIIDFDIIMDKTKATSAPALTSFLGRLELLTKAQRMSDVCTVHPDIKISTVTMVDSASAVGVRMSDLVAGLFSWSFKSEKNRKSFVATALSLNIEDRNLIHMINSDEVTPEELGMTGARNPWG